MKLTCPMCQRTKERIECKALGSLCLHQYYKVCKGRYELTERAYKCPIARSNENEN